MASSSAGLCEGLQEGAGGEGEGRGRSKEASPPENLAGGGAEATCIKRRGRGAKAETTTRQENLPRGGPRSSRRASCGSSGRRDTKAYHEEDGGGCRRSRPRSKPRPCPRSEARPSAADSKDCSGAETRTETPAEQKDSHHSQPLARTTLMPVAILSPQATLFSSNPPRSVIRREHTRVRPQRIQGRSGIVHPSHAPFT